MIHNNPFLQKTYTKIWVKHFSYGQDEFMFSFIPFLKFIKHPFFNIFTNIGHKNTKGITYSITSSEKLPLKNKLLLIYDIHTFFQSQQNSNSNSLRLKKIIQYPGFLCELENYPSASAYMKSVLSKKSNYRFHLYQKKLEHSFEIEYKMYFGSISKETYAFLFKCFHQLLVKRFHAKEETNNNLHPKEWNFFSEVTYLMLIEKKASLFVIYTNKVPIAITLLHFSDNIAFDTIRVFDIAYSSFRLGTISTMKQIEWCYEQQIKYLDFSKGDYEYKERWATQKYNFEYHVLYDSKSFQATSLAFLITGYYNLKQVFRKYKLHTLFHQFTFFLGNKKKKMNIAKKIEIYNSPSQDNLNDYAQIAIPEVKNQQLIKVIFDFLFTKSEKFRDIHLFKSIHQPDLFYIKGKYNSGTFKIG